MSTFTIHTIETAPAKSKKILENSLKTTGMIANLQGVMAEAPGLLEGYTQLNKLFQSSSFDKEEITVVWQTLNVEHECHYCVPAHTVIASMMKVDTGLTEALREGKPMPTEKLQILQDTTLAMARKRGRLTDEEIETFYAAGYEKRQLLEIVLGISHKVMSNYVNHFADTPVDEPFKNFAWKK